MTPCAHCRRFNEATAISCGDREAVASSFQRALSFNEATAISCGDQWPFSHRDERDFRFNEATAISCGDPQSSVRR